MFLIIDRIEENKVICEELKTVKKFSFDISEVPLNSKEGDILKYEDGVFTIESEMTKKRKADIDKIFDGLF